jgi:hypothetical protein
MHHLPFQNLLLACMTLLAAVGNQVLMRPCYSHLRNSTLALFHMVHPIAHHASTCRTVHIPLIQQPRKLLNDLLLLLLPPQVFKKPDPKELVRKWQADLRAQQRKIDRQIRGEAQHSSSTAARLGHPVCPIGFL